MTKLFTFLWTLIEGVIEIMSSITGFITQSTKFMYGFGALGTFVVALLLVRVIKWVVNR